MEPCTPSTLTSCVALKQIDSVLVWSMRGCPQLKQLVLNSCLLATTICNSKNLNGYCVKRIICLLWSSLSNFRFIYRMFRNVPVINKKFQALTLFKLFNLTYLVGDVLQNRLTSIMFLLISLSSIFFRPVSHLFV